MMRLTLSRSLATISGGVPLGANKPNQEPARNPLKPASSMVGTSGSERERWGLLTANGFNLPDSIRERTDGMVANIKCTRPASSEERREGKECVSTCRSGWSPNQSKKKIKKTEQEYS